MNSTAFTTPAKASIEWHGGVGSRAGDVSEADTLTFASACPRLFGIAYRMLRSGAEADDVVQDTWIRWQTTDRTKVRSATAFLATTTTRLAVNVLQSARVRHETGVGTQVREPVDSAAGTTDRAEQTEELAASLRTLMARLSPPERAAYVLREAFDYPYRDIARVLATSPANARQHASRARTHLADRRDRPIAESEHRRLFDTFIAAAQAGELAALEDLLAGTGGPAEACAA